MTQDTILKRLSYIKYLYNLGVEQSKQAEVISFSSILCFHDSIDFFVQLSAEYYGIKSTEKLFLMDYFNKISSLTMEASVGKINKRRNNLKHNGQIPAKSEIEESKITTTLFFEENTLLIFKLDFNEVSLTNLIIYKEVRNHLYEAELNISKNKKLEAIKEIAVAFFELMNIEEDFRNRNGLSNPEGIVSGEQMLRILDEAIFDGNKSKLRKDINFQKIIELYDKNFDKLGNYLKVLSMGIDYRKYKKFTLVTPFVYKNSDNELNIGSVNIEIATNENIQFMQEFVLDCAIKFQEFGYSE